MRRVARKCKKPVKVWLPEKNTKYFKFYILNILQIKPGSSDFTNNGTFNVRENIGRDARQIDQNTESPGKYGTGRENT